MNLDSESFVRKCLSKDLNCLLLLSGFVILLVSPMIYWGTPNGFDLAFHYQLAFAYFDSFNSGDFFPSWSLITNSGFGDTAIRYYPPLAHYLLALTQLIVGDWLTTTLLNIIFWMGLASFGAYLFAKQLLSPLNSMWVAILYAIAPYHLSQIYQYFLFSEFAAAAILPFCFLFLTKICQNQTINNSIWLGISLTLLVLCHIPTTIIATVCLGIYTVLIIDWGKFRTIFFKLFVSGIIALTSTSFYWVKLITESAFSNQSNAKQFSGLYNYKIHFFPFYLSQPDLYFIKQLWLKDITSILTLLFILPILVWICWKINRTFFSQNRNLIAIVFTATFAFFMSSSLSLFLWLNLSFLQKLQFPFRWLTVAGLLGVFSFVIVISQLQFSDKIAKTSKKYLLLIFLICLVLFNITQVIIPSEALPRDSFDKRLQELQSDEGLEVTRTVWTKSEAFNQTEKVSAPNRNIKIIVWEAENREFEIEPGAEIKVQIATFYYPYWQAKVNEKVVEVEKADNGTILIPITAENSKVQLIFTEPFFVRAANLISFFSWLMLIIISSFLVISKMRKRIVY